jgi:hypothetical protein
MKIVVMCCDQLVEHLLCIGCQNLTTITAMSASALTTSLATATAAAAVVAVCEGLLLVREQHGSAFTAHASNRLLHCCEYACYNAARCSTAPDSCMLLLQRAAANTVRTLAHSIRPAQCC